MRMIVVVTIVLLVISIIGIWAIKNYVSVGFADKVTLRYHTEDKKIDIVLTDADDISELKSMFKGIAIRDNPSCGFTLDISLTFSKGDKSVTLCPAAGDKCPILRVNDTNRYISITDKQRQCFEEILGKYEVTLPAAY